MADGGFDAGDMGGGGGSFGGGDYTESTTQSWFSRIGNAFKGILVGLVLFVVSFPLLFWNEGNAVRESGGIAQGKKEMISVASDKVDPANEKKLVHMSGAATTDEVLKDDDFGVEKKALRLQRSSEIHQWKEHDEPTTEKQTGGGTKTVHHYKYNLVWSDEPIDSSAFHDPTRRGANAGHETREFPAKTETAKKITVGAFTLTPGLVGHIPPGGTISASAVGIDKANPPVKANWKVAGEYFFRGGDPNSPKVGDQRVKFVETPPQDVSLYAQQVGNSFEPFVAKTGSTLEDLVPGTKSAEEMLNAAQERADMQTWILRLVGFVLMAVGVYLIFQPLVVFADVLPFLGNFLSMGVGLFAVLVALPLTLVTIAIAWIFYRPILGVGLLVAAGLFVGLLFYFRRRGPSRIATAPTQPS